MPHVTVVWADRSETEARADQALDSFEARRWLDEQFVALDCEPLRASGKVLVADKLLAVAATAGTGLFADAAWATQFAKVASGASARENVRIDIAEGTVSF